jgi:hypothetical protein
MEARPKGHQPISVTHKASSLDMAVDGAAVKLDHALEHLFGKLRSKRGGVSAISNAKDSDAESPDALLQEEFLEKDDALHG